MKNVIVLNKKEGETPLEALSNFRARHPEYKNESMTYAGRLDPMASGVLLLLVGDKIKEKAKYLALDKEYEFEILFAFATDTYDILGKATSVVGQDLATRRIQKLVKENLKYFIGKFIQRYPMYSSKTVRGKSLFAYARGGEEVERPEREVNVKSLKLMKIKRIKSEKLLQNIEKRIQKVKGDFRQKEILKIWRKNLSVQHRVSNIASFKIKCGSGTYVRGVANSFGEKLGIPALAFGIRRMRVGRYKV